MCEAPRKKGGRLASCNIRSLLLPLPAAASRSCRWRAAACLMEQKRVVSCVRYDIIPGTKSQDPFGFLVGYAYYLKDVLFVLRILCA